jgi:hypothetical protein
MTIGDLNIKIAELVNNGCNIDSEVYVDTEAREYDTHLVPVKNICYDDGLCDVVITIN